MPRPSAGIQSRRVNGFARKQTVAMKKRRMAPSVPVAHGVSSGLRRRLGAIAIAEYIERIRAQNSIEPACPLQNAEKTYGVGMVELILLATYSNEKSRFSRAVHNPRDASTIIPNVM